MSFMFQVMSAYQFCNDNTGICAAAPLHHTDPMHHDICFYQFYIATNEKANASGKKGLCKGLCLWICEY